MTDNRKKLIIHIGYPKTATTTLQFSLFTGLHKKGKINFLGKTPYKYRKKGRNEFDNQAKNLFKFLRNNKVVNMSSHIVSDKLNLISNESLTQPRFHNKKNDFRYENIDNYCDYDPFSYVENLNQIFSDIENIEILISLRRQRDLIYSLYVQQYRRFIHTELNNWSNYFDYLVENLERDFKVYNFYNLAHEYARYFGKENIKFLLFEDFINNRNEYFNDLGKIMGINAFQIKNNFKNQHYRKRNKSNRFSFRKVKIPNKFGQFLLNIKDGLNSNLGENIIRKIYKEIGRKKEEFKLKRPSREQHKFIYNKFRGSNLKLAEEYNLNMEKLKRYQYF